ncbi:LPS export ABC transporter permease LptG [Roseitalea porphyridii]|nr:LPS export ABC transporter permease LptG [Roseitalea porphyridii]
MIAMQARTLQVYVFLRVLRMVGYFTLAIAALALLVDFTELSNRTGSLPDYTALRALGISAMRVPFILQVALPFVMLFATIATLIALNRKYELVVARAAGMSAWQFLTPTWAAALIIGLAGTLILNPLAANGFSLAQAIEGSWRGSGTSGLFETREPWLRQGREGGGAFIITAKTVAGQQVSLYEATFLEIGADQRVLARHDADRARLEEGRWVLEAVTTSVARRRPVRTDQMIVPTRLDQEAIRQALVPPEMVPIYSLGRQIEAARSFGVPAAPFSMQYHSLIALPALMVAMTMIAATVSLRFVRFGQSARLIVAGVAAGFLLYVVTALAKSFGGAGAMPPVVAAWLPVVGGILFGIGYLLNHEDG